MADIDADHIAVRRIGTRGAVGSPCREDTDRDSHPTEHAPRLGGVITHGSNPEVTLSDGLTIPQLGFGTLAVQPDRQSTPANPNPDTYEGI